MCQDPQLVYVSAPANTKSRPQNEKKIRKISIKRNQQKIKPDRNKKQSKIPIAVHYRAMSLSTLIPVEFRTASLNGQWTSSNKALNTISGGIKVTGWCDITETEHSVSPHKALEEDKE